MSDPELVAFLQWALPLLHLRWPGFRKVRRQVRRRLVRRMTELGLGELQSYREHLQRHPEEWAVLDRLCWISISRFYRDRGIFDRLRCKVLPRLVEQALNCDAGELRAWSAGCASGEEPYTLALIYQLELRQRFEALQPWIVATDANPLMLRRARRGVYARSSLRELPATWIERGFLVREDGLALRKEVRQLVTFDEQDIRRQLPAGRFRLVLCRNLVLTYFDHAQQVKVMQQVAQRVEPGGVLVLGCHERLPQAVVDFEQVERGWPIYLRR